MLVVARIRVVLSSSGFDFRRAVGLLRCGANFYSPSTTRLRAALWMPLSPRPPSDCRLLATGKTAPIASSLCTHLSHPIPYIPASGELNTIPPRSLCTRLPVSARERASKLSPRPRERVSLPFGRRLAVADGCGQDWGHFSIALLCCCVHRARPPSGRPGRIMIEMSDPPGDQSSSSWLQAAKHLSLTLSVAPVSRRYRPLSTRVHWQASPASRVRAWVWACRCFSGSQCYRSSQHRNIATSQIESPPSDAVHMSTPPATVHYSALVSSSACAALRRTGSGQG